MPQPFQTKTVKHFSLNGQVSGVSNSISNQRNYLDLSTFCQPSCVAQETDDLSISPRSKTGQKQGIFCSGLTVAGDNFSGELVNETCQS